MTKKTGHNSREHLKKIISNIQHLEAEKKEIGDQIKEVFSEAKGAGFDAKIIKKLLKAAENPEKFKEELTLLEVYSDNAQLDLFK